MVEIQLELKINKLFVAIVTLTWKYSNDWSEKLKNAIKFFHHHSKEEFCWILQTNFYSLLPQVWILINPYRKFSKNHLNDIQNKAKTSCWSETIENKTKMCGEKHFVADKTEWTGRRWTRIFEICRKNEIRKWEKLQNQLKWRKSDKQRMFDKSPSVSTSNIKLWRCRDCRKTIGTFENYGGNQHFAIGKSLCMRPGDDIVAVQKR